MGPIVERLQCAAEAAGLVPRRCPRQCPPDIVTHVKVRLEHPQLPRRWDRHEAARESPQTTLHLVNLALALAAPELANPTSPQGD
eukprot:9471840-Pyramimonas_sp.AAC.4